MGWDDLDLSTTLVPDRGGHRRGYRRTLWARHGAFQACVYRFVFDALDTLPESAHRVVSYESVCRDPVTAFAGLFPFAGLDCDASERERMREHSRTPGDGEADPYSAHRVSRSMICAWREDLTSEQLRAVRSAFLALNESSVYGADAWET